MVRYFHFDFHAIKFKNLYDKNKVLYLSYQTGGKSLNEIQKPVSSREILK
jgi:hypothetical protein